MYIYEFLDTLNDNDNAVYTLFDCNSEDLVFMATDEVENTCEFKKDDLLYSNYSDYEIGSMDMWVRDDGKFKLSSISK